MVFPARQHSIDYIAPNEIIVNKDSYEIYAGMNVHMRVSASPVVIVGKRYDKQEVRWS